MSAFESELLRRLAALEEQNLFRKLRSVSSPQQVRVRIDGRELINFSSNDYLGLAADPRLKAAAQEAIERWGAGSGASRLISGSIQPHTDLEEALSSFKGTEAALTFSSGYATALGTITALVEKGDILILDKLVHASIVDAARLSGATMRVFHHNDLNDLQEILQWADKHREHNILVVTETLFSMDGDFAPLKELVALKERFGAWLMIDEAHATGLFGMHRRGVAEQCEVSDRIEIQMGTLGKALGSAGGYIAGSRALIDYLTNKARSFIFSTAPPPSASAAAKAALSIVRSNEGIDLVEKLHANIKSMYEFLSLNETFSPILPWIVGSEENALRLADLFRDNGVFVPAIRYPSVARGKARLRFTASSSHTAEEINSLRRISRLVT